MAKLTEEAKTAIGTIRPSFIATASKTGKPNVSAKGSLRILDDEHIIFADISSPRTIANIKENPQVAIICLDSVTRKGARIWGKGEVISSGDIFEKIASEFARRSVNVKNIVNISVEEIETF